MANLCEYELAIRGAKENVDALILILKGKDKNKSFLRIDSAEEFDRNDNADGTVTAYICGDCGWSILTAMLPEKEHIQHNSRLTSLAEQSKEKHLEIEAWGREQGIGFEEYYRWSDGKELANEEREMFEVDLRCFEPSIEDCDEEELKKVLNEAKTQLRNNETFVRMLREHRNKTVDELTVDDFDDPCDDYTIRLGGYENAFEFQI